jgi:MFS family permease
MEANATFPLKEMTILATAVFASAISLSGLFPYVGFMVISLGEAKDENEAGYFSGYIASAMMFGRLVSSFWWGQIADKWGRKPVLILGCLSIAIFSISFGCANNFQLALISRFLLGDLSSLHLSHLISYLSLPYQV